ncbi:MAG: RDD family protein [Actinomycetota bacterium]|nr:RDD family protein [Actinomycetota bacterium]
MDVRGVKETTHTQTESFDCRNCGARLDASTRFCGVCGAAVATRGTRAGFGPRYAAFLVDLSLILGIWLVQSLFTQPLARLLPVPATRAAVDAGAIRQLVGTPFELTLLFLVAAFYFALSQARARTVGERVVGLRVRRITGGPSGFSRSVIRAAVFWGPLLLLFSGNVIALFGVSGLARAMTSLGAASFVVIWLASVSMVLFWRQRRGVHDLAAGTEMIRD